MADIDWRRAATCRVSPDRRTRHGAPRALSALLIPALLLAASFAMAQPAGVDAIWVNGRVHTVNPAAPEAEAFAVSGERFVAVGSSEAMLRLAGEQTVVHDLAGRRVLPGLVDDHIHPDLGMESWFNLRIDPEGTTFEQFKAALADHMAAHPDAPWVFGSAMDYMWDDGSDIRMFGMPSHNAWLDELIPDRPAYFWEVSGHAALVNSAAFEALGIDRDTPDPAGGHFVRDADGELTGVVRETAAHLFWEAFLANELPPAELATRQLLPILQYLASLGLTSISDVWSRESMVRAYGILDTADRLPLRVSVYVADPIEWVSDWMRDGARRVLAEPDAYSTDQVRILGAKFVLDGGAAGQTAVMTEPFEGTEATGPWRNDPDVFAERTLEYDRRGLTVRAHGAGDGAIRWALDVFERTRREQGSTLRHGIAHNAILNPGDIHRFAELGLLAEISPVFWYQMPAVEVIRDDIGARLEWLYPARSLLDSGARLSVGSDWTVTPANPWAAIETLVTRRAPGVQEGPALVPGENISLQEAIHAYTMGGAWAQYRETEIGSIEPGKYADFVVLDQDILEIPIHRIHATRVVRTVLGGQTVYHQDQENPVISFDGG